MIYVLCKIEYIHHRYKYLMVTEIANVILCDKTHIINNCLSMSSGSRLWIIIIHNQVEYIFNEYMKRSSHDLNSINYRLT